MEEKDLSKYRVLIAIPAMRSVMTDFFISVINLEYNGNTLLSVAANSLVYDARNYLVKKAIENEVDYMFFVDSDMVFDSKTMVNLLRDAVENDLDYVTALTFRRQFPTSPTVAKTLSWYQEEDTHLPHGAAEVYSDYPRDQLFEIAGSGLACTLVKLEAIGRAANAYQMSPFEPLPNLSEDYSFCFRLKELGIKMYCDSRVKVGHVGDYIFNEEVFLKQEKEKKDGCAD